MSPTPHAPAPRSPLATARGARTHVDRGGTFTDVVHVAPDGRATTRKVPSDVAVIGALDLGQGALTFGTTVATNALLERRFARVLLVVSAGFGDLARIGDQARPALFDLDLAWPPPPVTRVLEVGGRIAGDGHELEPLTLPATLPLDDIDAVAIALLNSHRNGAHELAVASLLPPGLHVALGHALSPELGYLARIETALVDAAVTPPLRAALARDHLPPGALAMRSDGSLCPADALRAPDAMLSGPAGGVLAVLHVAALAGFSHAVGLDMGGTSTDVCRVTVGAPPRHEGDLRVAGLRIRRPALEVVTIAAGGGSVLASDGLRYTVGPASAGADPGPQCYGRGGPPTLTDAALEAGLIAPSRFPLPLDPRAVALPGPAAAFLAIAREAMAQAIARLTTARGVSLDDHALVAYGGASGQHAAYVAELLGVDTVLLHPCAAVFCAFGQALARREESAVRSLWAPLPAAFDAAVRACDALLAELPPFPEVLRTLELRHHGADHAVPIPLRADDDAASLLARFEAEHRARYGFSRPGHAVEVKSARVRVREAPVAPPPVDEDPFGLAERVVRGPARLDSDMTTVAVPPGWEARRQRGLLRLDRVAAPPAPAPPSTTRTPAAVALWGNRFQALLEEAGVVLQRLARSVNIRERLDFSCALFDGDGRLVANAPHIPVHLGAMGETVRDLIAREPAVGLDPGAPPQHWLTNDPAAGGSHLPDLTVVTPIHHEGARFFVASRGHHVDVGGSTPGSMPPGSTRLADEGFVVRQLPLLDPAGALRPLAAHLAGCRDVATVLADLEAQLASNAHAARRLLALGPAALLRAWMGHLHDVAAEATRALAARLPAGSAEDELDGVPLAVTLTPDDAGGGLTIDFTGTGGPHPGNLNAPPAVVRAAVLFALRVLIGRPIPLNEGCLAPVRLVVPAPSILAPPAGAAVVGGNVETSQRLVDLLLAAAGARASSAGTMANLTLGADAFAYYETLGGGLGATLAQGGASGRQTHMTNTRATDPEVIEARLPLRVRRFSLRAGSGGDGAQRGGDGLVRELELTRGGTAALLAAFRPGGALGLAGGGPGAPGQAEVRVAGTWRPWDGAALDLAAGDRVRVHTPGGGGAGLAAAPTRPHAEPESPP